MPIETEAKATTKQTWLAYILTPQVLLGGVLVWFAGHAWEYGKELRDGSDKVVAEVRDTIRKQVIPTPKTVTAIQNAIDALEKELTFHQDSKAQDLLNRQLADLARLRDKLIALEESKKRADTARVAARAEAEKATQAAMVAKADASAMAKAAAVKEAERQQEISRAAASAAKVAQEKEAVEAAKAERAQRWFDRAPK